MVLRLIAYRIVHVNILIPKPIILMFEMKMKRESYQIFCE